MPQLWCAILTAHVTDNLVTQLVLSIPAQLEVAFQSLHVRLKLDDEAEVVLPSLLVALLVSIPSLPAGITTTIQRFGVRSIDIFVLRVNRLVEVIIGFTIGERTRAGVTRPEQP